MNCRTVQRLLPQYQDADVTGEEARGIEAHLAGCEACSTELAQLDSVMALVAGLPDLAPAADFTQNVLAAIAAEDSMEPAREPERPLVGLWLGGVGMAVSLVGLATLALAWPTGLASAALPAIGAIMNFAGIAYGIAVDLTDALFLASRAHGLWIMIVHIILLALVHMAWKRLKPAELIKQAGAAMIA